MGRLREIDCFKAIAALMVILIHLTATPVTVLTEGVGYEAALLLNRFSKPSVPMFIFVSGLALYYGYREKAFHYGAFLRRRAAKVLLPYFFWCAVYYAWFLRDGVYVFDLRFFFWNLISGKMMYHLYFVVAIVQYYVLFGILRAIVQKYPARFVLPAAAALNLAEVCLIPDLYYGRFFATYLFVFLLGCYTAKHLEQAERLLTGSGTLSLLAAGTLGTGALYTLQFVRDLRWETGVFDDDKIVYLFFSALMSLLVYGLCTLLCKKKEAGGGIAARAEAALCRIGEPSFYIYLAHPLFMLIGGKAASALGGFGVLREAALSLALILLFCIPLSCLYANWRAKRHKMQKSYETERN